jgi:hypothetical protein
MSQGTASWPPRDAPLADWQREAMRREWSSAQLRRLVRRREDWGKHCRMMAYGILLERRRMAEGMRD